MRGQRFKLLPEFQISDPVSMITLPEFSIVDSCLKLDPIKCTTGPVEHVEFKSDGTMIWYERSRKIVVKSSKQTSTYRYKEEGGQGNALSVDVRLLDSKGKIVLGQAVPFELQCLTRFMKSVENQDEILQVKKRKGHDTVLKINEDTGTATVVFRFDKVSSKHKGPFSLHVGPNLARDATCARIYGSRSTPVVVKSKRSKESKRKLAAMKSSSNGDGALTTTTTKTKENKRRRKVGKMNKDALRVAVEHKAAVPTTSSTKLLKIGTLSAVFFSRQDSPHNTSRSGTKAKRGMIRPSSSTAKKAVSTKPEQIATRNLSMWVRETKCILSKLQFGLVGYGVAADGTLDSTRRILRCPSCWAQFEEHNDEKTQYTLQNSKHEPGCTIRVLLDLYVVQS